MKTNRWEARLAIGLLLAALAAYAVRWFVFSGPELQSEMLRFLVGDIAFLFVQVLLVTLVLDRLIRQRAQEETRRKLNMVIGAFFSQTGKDLLGLIAGADAELAEVRSELVPSYGWRAAEYERARSHFRAHEPSIDLTTCDLERLRSMLVAERPFLIGLLANQALLEHATFTDALWAITHLGEELEARPALDALEPADARHLALDLKRAYTQLGLEWLSYMQHLQTAYPFLFSLAVRSNPLDPDAHIAVADE